MKPDQRGCEAPAADSGGHQPKPQMVTSEAGQAFLVRLGDTLRNLADPIEVQVAASRLLGEYLGADRAYYYEYDEPAGCGVIHRVYYREGEARSGGVFRFADFPSAHSALRGGMPLVVADVRNASQLGAEERARFDALGSRAFIRVPLVKDCNLVAAFNVSQLSARDWTPLEVSLVRETAECTWAAVGWARVQAELRASDDQYRSLFNSIDQGFCIIQVLFGAGGEANDFRYLEANPAFGKLTGLAGATGKTVRELVPNVEAHWLEVYGEIALTGVPARFERASEALGRHFDCYAFRIGAPEQRRVAVLFNEVMARKRREAHLAFLSELSEDFGRYLSTAEIMRAAGERIRAYLKVSGCVFAEVDEARDTTTVVYTSRSPELPVLPGPHRLSEYVTGEFRQAARAGQTVVVRNTQTDPRTVAKRYAARNIYSYVAVPFVRGGEWKYQFSVHDSAPRDWRQDEIELIREVTNRAVPRLERARAEEALRESEQRFRSLFENSADGVLIITDDFRILAANSAACAMFGKTEEEICRAGRAGIIDPEDPKLAEMTEERRRTGRCRGELTYVRKDGSKFLSETTSAIVNESKRGFVIVRDITDRKRAEEALRASEARERARAAELNAILETAPVPLFVSHDAEGRLITGNRMAYEMLRLPQGSNTSKSAPPGQVPTSFRVMKNGGELPPEELPAQKAAATGQPVRDYEFEVVFDDGTSRMVLGSAVPLAGEDGRSRGAVSAFVDITDHNRTQERLRQSQRLESVGLLAGGIAHDFNNLLTTILGNASLTLPTVDARAAERIRDIMASAERAADLTRQLLAYSGKGQFVIRDLNVVEAMREIGGLVQSSIPRSVRLSITAEGRLPAVRMDPGQFQQILMNLVINAGEAIGTGNPGRIMVVTSMTDVARPFLDALGEEVAAGRYVTIEVSDTGDGIEEEKLPRIFEPFFTTKSAGRGLGLAAVAGVVRSARGGITMRSESGRGSSFLVYLPAVGRHPRGGERPDSSRGTVLVVDDEPSVRDFIAVVLRQRGYHVLPASDGKDALAVLKREGPNIDASVVDVVMPLMGAHGLLPELRARHPKMKILLTSGYSEPEARRLCESYPGAAFIQKPYTAERIGEAVDELLAEKRPKRRRKPASSGK